MAAEVYPIQQIIQIPSEPEPDGEVWKDSKDAIVFAKGKIFYFKKTHIYDWVLDNLEDYSVKVWKSKSKSKGRRWETSGEFFNQFIMEISLTQYSWRKGKPIRPGQGYSEQFLNEITEEELPALKERVVMQII